MNEGSSLEIWQVEVNGIQYEASFEELTQWVAEGALQPQDKVRRGNLRWIEAGKVPLLYGSFNAKQLDIPPPVEPPQSHFPTYQIDLLLSLFGCFIVRHHLGRKHRDRAIPEHHIFFNGIDHQKKHRSNQQNKW